MGLDNEGKFDKWRFDELAKSRPLSASAAGSISDEVVAMATGAR